MLGVPFEVARAFLKNPKKLDSPAVYTLQINMHTPLFTLCFLAALCCCSVSVQAQEPSKSPTKANPVKEAGLDSLGVDFPLDDKTRVNVRMTQGRFELYFIDKNRVPQKLKYSKAFLRFSPVRPRTKGQKNTKITLSAASQGKWPCLRANKPLRAPYNGKILVTLLGKGTNKSLGVAQFNNVSGREGQEGKEQ